jgi:uncharacterized Fe-S cluster protein YjdI
MAAREYEGKGITVYWDSDRCVHSQRCWRGVPSVFDPRDRPWVHPEGAPADEVARVIDTCPSGALSYTRTDGAPNGRRGRTRDEDPSASVASDIDALTTVAGEPEAASPPAGAVATITPQLNGPLHVRGPVAITRPDGAVEIAKRLVLCRCGQSDSKPNCDGSHARVGFLAAGRP